MPPPPPAQQWSSYQQSWSPPPAYGAAPYYARLDEYGSSPLATVAGVLLLVIGGIITLLGLSVLFIGIVAAPFLESIEPAVDGGAAAVSSLIAVFGVVFLVIGILGMAAGIGVFVHKSWARWLGVTLAGIALALGFMMLIGAMSDASPDGADLVISVLWVASNAFIVAALVLASEHFKRGYQQR